MVVHFPDRKVQREKKVKCAVGTKADGHEELGIWCPFRSGTLRMVSWEMNPILNAAPRCGRELYKRNLDEEMGRNSSGCSRR